MDGVTRVPVPYNEPVRQYQPDSADRAALAARIKELAGERAELTMTIGGRRVMGSGERVPVVQPHNFRHVLGEFGNATDADVADAIAAAKQAAPSWRALSFDDRAAVFLRAADLLAGPWRATVNAATVLGQSKSAYQAEIDAACELIDFFRYNVAFARQLLSEQPASAPGAWNRMEYRPLEGFVLAITPFNFTSIAGNLPTAPALIGNVVVWKPSPTQQLAAHYTMALLEAAGLPPGVINLVTGDGQAVSRVALSDPALAGIHFTGSTGTFQHLWRTVGQNIERYRDYPRLVGETGGKDFVIVHPSADLAPIATTLVRGCLRVPGPEVLGRLPRLRARLAVARRPGRAGRRHPGAPLRRRLRGPVAVRRRGHRRARGRQAPRGVRPGPVPSRRSASWLAARSTTSTATSSPRPSWSAPTRPTRCSPPSTSARSWPSTSTRTPDYQEMLAQAADVAPYALTGSILATDRTAIAEAAERLRYSAGNFYVNDKPTGAVVGQQPFGGARGQRHRRQGRLGLQPDPLGLRPGDQGDVRPADRLPLPAHGVAGARGGRASHRSRPPSRPGRGSGTRAGCFPRT